MWEYEGAFLREDELKKLKERVEIKAAACNFELRLVGGLLKFTPARAYTPIFLELEQPVLQNLVVIYKHRASSLTSKYQGKAVSKIGLFGFYNITPERLKGWPTNMRRRVRPEDIRVSKKLRPCRNPLHRNPSQKKR